MLGSRPLDLLLEQQTQARHVGQRLWDRELILPLESGSLDLLHGSKHVGAISRINLSDRETPSIGSLHGHLKRAAPSRMVLQDLKSKVLNGRVYAGKSLPKLTCDRARIEDRSERRNSRIADERRF